MYCQASPSFGTNRCTIASVAGSPPSTWYSSAPATGGVLAKPARSPRYRPSSRSGFIPSSTRRNSFMIRLWPNTTDVLLCSARNTDGSGVVGPVQRGAQDRGGPPGEPAAADALQVAPAADGVEEGAADVGVHQGLGEDGRVVAPPDAGDDAARGVGLQVLGALALDHGERDGVGLGLALRVLDPDDQDARGQRAARAGERQRVDDRDVADHAAPCPRTTGGPAGSGRARAPARPRRRPVTRASIEPDASITGKPTSSASSVTSAVSMASQ